MKKSAYKKTLEILMLENEHLLDAVHVAEVREQETRRQLNKLAKAVMEIWDENLYINKEIAIMKAVKLVEEIQNE